MELNGTCEAALARKAGLSWPSFVRCKLTGMRIDGVPVTDLLAAYGKTA